MKIFSFLFSLFSFLFYLLPSNLNAQIKVFSAGKVTIGGTSAPNGSAQNQIIGDSYFTGKVTLGGNILPIGVQHQIIGDKVAFTANTSSINSAPLIRGQNSYSSTLPGYTWYGDDGTGIGHPSWGNTSFLLNGSEVGRINDAGKFYIGPYNASYTALLNINSGANGLATLNTVHIANADWAPSQVNYVNRALTKGIVVSYNGGDKFYVRGDGVVWANSYQTWSDSTLKEDIRPISSALSLLQGVRGVSYLFKQEGLKSNALPSTYIPPKSSKRTYGLIAQEIETILPEAVETDDKGLKSVSYNSLIPILIESIKELKTEVDELRSKLNECCQRKSLD